MTYKSEDLFVETAFSGYYASEITENEVCCNRIFNPGNYEDDGLSKMLDIAVVNGTKRERFAIICPPYSHSADFIFEEQSIVFLLNDFVARFNLESRQIEKTAKLDDFGTYFNICEYDDGFIARGEIHIVKPAKDLSVQWTFSTRDIFVTQDNSLAFTIRNGNILLYDRLGYCYELGRDGKEIEVDINAEPFPDCKLLGKEI
jgi:hypothetical protein